MKLIQEVRTGSKPLLRACEGIFPWFTARAIQAAAIVDEQVRKEFENLPDNFTFSSRCLPKGPWMVIGKEHLMKGQMK